MNMEDAVAEPTIEAYYLEERTFPPPDAFRAGALVADESLHQEADADPEAFWARQADELVTWFEPWTTVCEWELPFAKWFVGGKLNVSYNCLDRHVEAGLGDRVAYHWEGEPGDTETITYAELQRDVVRFANVLRELGVRRGTPVAIYMGMVPELPVAMLACTRLGAPHTVVFGGFSADSLSGRVNDMECEVLITQDEAWRRGGKVPLKENADAALDQSPTIRHSIVLRRTGEGPAMKDGRDVWW